MGTGLEFGILGPLEVRRGGTPVRVGGPRQRALLGLLLCHANQVVSRDQLIDELLGDQLPGSAERMLRVQISRLRQVLADGGDGEPRLLARPPGYLLRVGDGELDLQVFEQRLAAGRHALEQGDPGRAAALLGAAEALWRGRPLADLEFESFAEFEIQRLEADRLLAVEERIEAELALGRHGALCPELGQLVAEHPLRERLRGQLMLALYRSGRQAEALALFHDTRRVLDAELGIEPGPELRRLHERVLAADPGLDPPAPAAMAALVAMPAPVVPRELPADVSAFTGRAMELAELDLLLPAAEQDTGGAAGAVVISAVAGTAGVGKTTLAVRWAHRVQDAFPGGQLYINLRGYDPDQPVAPGEALAGFLRALGVAGPDIPLGEAERASRFRSVVAGKRLLMVLDNAATVAQVRPLLPGSPSVLVVVTSRDSLAGLVARDGAHRLNLDLLPLTEAVALLTTLIGARAQADPAAAHTLAALCARLPLALRVAAELAAGRPDIPLADLAAELASQKTRLELLDVGGDPQAAVTSVFSWSYKHLPADAARMFRLLGLHPAQDWDRYAAAALANISLAQASRLLNLLARAHLIQPAAPGRHQMHDLLRAYAATQAGSHDSDQARRAALTGLFDYYLAAGAAAMECLAPAERKNRPDPPVTSVPVPDLSDRTAALAWLDAELATLVSVSAHTAEHGWPSHATRLPPMIVRYLQQGRYTEGLIMFAHALNAARDSGDRSSEARALNGLGNIHINQSRYTHAADCLQQALVIARDIGDHFNQVRALSNLAFVYSRQGRYEQAIRYCRRGLALSREVGYQVGEARMLGDLGREYLRQGRYGQAADQLRQALTLSRGIGDRYGEAESLIYLGEVCYWQSRYGDANDQLQQARALSREIGDRQSEAEALPILGAVCYRQGSYGQAAEYHQEALTIYRDQGDRDGQANALNGAGAVLLATGQPNQARTCHTTALTLSRHSGDRYLQARALTGLGDVSRQADDHDQAVGYYQQALDLYREIGDPGGQAEALNGAGETLLATGRPDQARDYHTTVLTITSQTGNRYQQARAHHGLAAAYQATGQPGQAHQHWQHALDIYTDLGVPEAAQMRTSPPAPGARTPAGSG